MPVLIFTAVVALGLGIYIKTKKGAISISNQDEESVPSPVITEIPSLTLTLISTSTPTPAKKPKPIISKIPSPTPTIDLSDCGRFKPEDGLATITIVLKEKDGKPLYGDWTVTIKPTGNCPAILPYGNKPITDIIRQPTYTFTTVGFHPGQVRVDVKYHYTGEGFDVDATSGNHVREVTVSN